MLLLLLTDRLCVQMFADSDVRTTVRICICVSMLQTAVRLCVAADGHTPHAAAVAHGLLPLAIRMRTTGYRLLFAVVPNRKEVIVTKCDKIHASCLQMVVFVS